MKEVQAIGAWVKEYKDTEDSVICFSVVFSGKVSRSWWQKFLLAPLRRYVVSNSLLSNTVAEGCQHACAST